MRETSPSYGPIPWTWYSCGGPGRPILGLASPGRAAPPPARRRRHRAPRRRGSARGLDPLAFSRRRHAGPARHALAALGVARRAGRPAEPRRRRRRRATAADGCRLPPVEARLTRLLLDRLGAVVSREALAKAGWPDGAPGRNALDVHVLRLRRRLARGRARHPHRPLPRLPAGGRAAGPSPRGGVTAGLNLLASISRTNPFQPDQT